MDPFGVVGTPEDLDKLVLRELPLLDLSRTGRSWLDPADGKYKVRVGSLSPRHGDAEQRGNSG